MLQPLEVADELLQLLNLFWFGIHGFDTDTLNVLYILHRIIWNQINAKCLIILNTYFHNIK